MNFRHGSSLCMAALFIVSLANTPSAGAMHRDDCEKVGRAVSHCLRGCGSCVQRAWRLVAGFVTVRVNHN